MQIKQNYQFRYSLDFNNFYYFKNEAYPTIGFLSYFLTSDFGYIKNDLESNILKLNTVESMSWNDDEIAIDQKNNIVYLGIVPDFCCDKEYDDIYEEKMKDKSLLQLYQENLLNHMTIPKDNFFYILRTWKKHLEKKPSFLLLYQDENDWFDILPFNSKEKMEQFTKNHQ
jgi:hypothetical protein